MWQNLERFNNHRSVTTWLVGFPFSYSVFQSSIIEKCGEFPNKFTCNFHVTQQRSGVEPHLQPFVKSNLHTEPFPRLAGMIDRLSHSSAVCLSFDLSVSSREAGSIKAARTSLAVLINAFAPPVSPQVGESQRRSCRRTWTHKGLCVTYADRRQW